MHRRYIRRILRGGHKDYRDREPLGNRQKGGGVMGQGKSGAEGFQNTQGGHQNESVKNNWGNSDTLQDHFDEHGPDFGATDPQDYAKKANEFYRNKNDYQIKVDTDGIIRVYDPATNTFGSYNADRTTRTFFKPTQEDKSISTINPVIKNK